MVWEEWLTRVGSFPNVRSCQSINLDAVVSWRHNWFSGLLRCCGTRSLSPGAGSGFAACLAMTWSMDNLEVISQDPQQRNAWLFLILNSETSPCRSHYLHGLTRSSRLALVHIRHLIPLSAGYYDLIRPNPVEMAQGANSNVNQHDVRNLKRLGVKHKKGRKPLTG